MSPLIIAFPPGAGGNHLRNLLDNQLSATVPLEQPKNYKTVHLRPGNNFKASDIKEYNIAHGHFGEIMSHQSLVRSIHDKKFIILSPDTSEDRELLYRRRATLGNAFDRCLLNGYFDGEQVFLYESFMYHYYFSTPFENIMNISISEWFQQDISDVLNRMSYFLNKPLDIQKCLELHQAWYSANLIES